MQRVPQIRTTKWGSLDRKYSVQPLHHNQIRTFRTSTPLNSLKLQRRPLSEPKGLPFTYTVTNPTITITRNKLEPPPAIAPQRHEEKPQDVIPVLQVMRRIETGTKYTKQFREQGLAPGVVVGGGKKPVPIVIRRGEIDRQTNKFPFVHRPYYLEIDGERELVRVRLLVYQGANDKYYNIIFQRTPIFFGTKPYKKDEGSEYERETEMLRVAYGMPEWDPRIIKMKTR